MKNHTKKSLKASNGITLIALVITIIVLLILAGISIAMLSGDNGVLQRATDAKTKSDEAQIKERIQLAYHSALTGGKGSYTKESLEDELENEFGENNYSVDDSDNANWILSAQGQNVTIPAGIKMKVAMLQGKEFLWGGNFTKVCDYNYISQITGVKRSNTKPSNEILEDSNHLCSTENSENKIYFWIDNNILWYWSEADRIFLNEDSSYLFCGWENLQDISGLKDFDASNVKNMYIMFCNCHKLSDLTPIKNWNTSKVVNMGQMFTTCENLKNVELNWDTSNVEDMHLLFCQCRGLETLDLSTWNTSKVTNMNQMFAVCSGLTTLNMGLWDTSEVTDMTSMFASCSKLTTLDLSTWDTSKVTNMTCMLAGLTNLTTIYTSNKFVTANVTNSNRMFEDSSSLKGGNGTVYDSSKVDKTYAHIDGGASNPGYFTAK